MRPYGCCSSLTSSGSLISGGDDRGGTLDQFFLVAAFVKVADQENDRVVRLADEGLAVRDCLLDVGAAAQLGAEEHLDGVFELVGEVDDGGVEDDELGAQC